MGTETAIQWCDHTFNCWRGCSKTSSAGCHFCYAEALSKRNPKTLGIWGPNGTRVVASESMWKEPLKWNRWAGELPEHIVKPYSRPIEYLSVPRPRVFCASLADVFEDWQGPMVDSHGRQLFTYKSSGHIAPWNEHELHAGPNLVATSMDDVRRRLFALIDATPNLDWLILTKRPENIRRMWPTVSMDSGPPDYQEEIKPVSGYPGYFVSNHGKVYSERGASKCIACGQGIIGGAPHKRYCSHRCVNAAYEARRSGNPFVESLERKELSLNVSSDGYCSVRLSRDGKKTVMLVQRLVLEYFDRPAREAEQARHLDGNTRNNAIHNLEWGTQSQNWDDSKRHGTHRRWSKLTEDDVSRIREDSGRSVPYSRLAEEYGVTATQISNVVRGKQWATTDNLFRKNCWLLTSISTQADAEKNIPELLKCRDLCPVLGVSAEPLLEEIDLNYDRGWLVPWERSDGVCGPDVWNGMFVCQNGHSATRYLKSETQGNVCLEGGCEAPVYPAKPGIQWVISGVESGPKRRPCPPGAQESLRDQCAAAGVAYFNKQMEIDGKVTGDIEKFPEDMRVRQWPNTEAHDA